MHRIVLAFRAFFRVLMNRIVAEKVEDALKGGGAEGAATQGRPATTSPGENAVAAIPGLKVGAARKGAVRSDAINLLAALQREARFVDFIKEPIAGYADAQIGAAVRDIHRDCGALIERIFGLRPIESAAEGAEIKVGEGFDPARIRLVGNVTGQPPFTGKLCHHGWEAARCELPAWTGGERSILVVSPAEVELR
jgi:hypothetical protein